MTNSFWVIAAVLGVGLAYKLPAFLRGGRNPLARQVAGLLLAACAVFFFAAPSTLAWLNDVTGIPNFAAPFVYSLITGFCASCLLLIVKWRGGTPTSVRRTTWWVYGSYGTVIVALWACFALGDHQVERLRDLDTYYATTPWMREMILLYLLGHTVAVLVTSALLWTWESRVRGTGWLHAGVVLLSVGYALNLVYDAVKLIAVVARWTGHNLDWLSTNVAPPVAGVVGLLIALGFLMPHAGEQISHRTSALREYRALEPLARALQQVPSAASPVPMGLRASLDLRLIHRRTTIRDALRQLQPHLDRDGRDKAAQHYLALGKTPAEAQLLAEATAIVAAAATPKALAGQAPEKPAQVRTDLRSDIVSLSRALRDLSTVHTVRPNATPEGIVTS
ncbi:MAB_1171c family putative transporter [Streptomyces sp. NPDC088794]|uniref:MAB_1171c family putative transporter n=1 Tax=Streptomyces sp. NPDC088794 TaxID=3365902 RepID=UPI00380E3B5A